MPAAAEQQINIVRSEKAESQELKPSSRLCYCFLQDLQGISSCVGRRPDMSFSRDFLVCCAKVVETIDADALENAVSDLAKVRDRQGRLFVIGS